jgi:thiamine-monophosphate kinase
MTMATALADGPEFDAIREIFEDGGPIDASVGPGDDGAVLPDGTVVSTDVAVEGVHFRAGWIGPQEAGERAVRAALSDLAAMGAHPVAVFAGLSGPERDRLVRAGVGVRVGAEAFGAALLGGDLARADGPLTIGVTVVGALRGRRPWRRSGARPGDAVWVTGELGAAAAAVQAWSSGGRPESVARERFVRPVPRFGMLPGLRGHLGPTAAIDLSDGLAADARHLAAASAVEVVIEEALVPVAGSVLRGRTPDAAVRLALGGGEDYELLLTGPDEEGVAAAIEVATGIPVTRIGRVGQGQGAFLESPDGTRRLLRGGFSHWTAP